MKPSVVTMALARLAAVTGSHLSCSDRITVAHPKRYYRRENDDQLGEFWVGEGVAWLGDDIFEVVVCSGVLIMV